MTPPGELCANHGGPEENDDWCVRCVAEMEAADAREAEETKKREEWEARIEAGWLSRGGLCCLRPFAFRHSSSPTCERVLQSLNELCDCQVCEDCGQPHNTGREEFAEDECQCRA